MPIPAPPSAPFESPAGSLLGLRRLLRVGRNLLIAAVAAVAFVEAIGEPLLRWEYRYVGRRDHPHMLDATYVGLSGARQVAAGQHAEGCPPIVFARPETPLWKKLTREMSKTFLSRH